ncbi:hypothetical protein [Flavobacterium sp.]|uniref:hypothetical protein n=1 Tax=Flavobacterium sp. TaxID=239 RepID=UPI00334163D0
MRGLVYRIRYVLIDGFVAWRSGDEPRPSHYKYRQKFKLKPFQFLINPEPRHFLKQLLVEVFYFP